MSMTVIEIDEVPRSGQRHKDLKNLSRDDAILLIRASSNLKPGEFSEEVVLSNGNKYRSSITKP